MEASGSRVNFGGGGGQSEGGHALAVFHQEWKRGETGLDGQNGNRGGEEAVRDPPLDLSPVQEKGNPSPLIYLLSLHKSLLIPKETSRIHQFIQDHSRTWIGNLTN